LVVRPPASRDIGVGSWVERRARIAPDHPALIAGGRSSSYSQLAKRVRCLANGLRGLGVAAGDRVAWVGPNHAAFLESLFAVGQLGAVLAPVNHRLDPEARAGILAQTRPTVLIQHLTAESTHAPSIRHRIGVGSSSAGAIDYETLVAGSADDEVGASVGLDDLLFLLHTSGTTGGPKAVMLTHGNVTWNAVNFLTVADFRSDDVTIAIAPFFRAGGTGVNVLPVMFVGGTVVVPDDPSPAGILREMERQRVTVGFGNPDLLEALMGTDRWPSADLSSIRFVVTGGAPVPERLIRAYLGRGVTLLQGYGLSEAGPFALLLDAERALEKIGSAGRPPLLVDIRIVDDDGREVPRGRTGELHLRGPNVMAGYWERPAETAEVLSDDGWLRTGDAARMDDDGDVWIVDRLEARYVSDGKVVYPGDVERVLMTDPSVADAGVVGITTRDAETGVAETHGVAFVVLRSGAPLDEDGLLSRCRTGLAAHEVPRSISFVDSLPRNAVGKLVRGELVALATRPRHEGD
jgi:fatty-acyl-CoA synthase